MSVGGQGRGENRFCPSWESGRRIRLSLGLLCHHKLLEGVLSEAALPSKPAGVALPSKPAFGSTGFSTGSNSDPGLGTSH